MVSRSSTVMPRFAGSSTRSGKKRSTVSSTARCPRSTAMPTSSETRLFEADFRLAARFGLAPLKYSSTSIEPPTETSSDRMRGSSATCARTGSNAASGSTPPTLPAPVGPSRARQAMAAAQAAAYRRSRGRPSLPWRMKLNPSCRLSGNPRRAEAAVGPAPGPCSAPRPSDPAEDGRRPARPQDHRSKQTAAILPLTKPIRSTATRGALCMRGLSSPAPFRNRIGRAVPAGGAVERT